MTSGADVLPGKVSLKAPLFADVGIIALVPNPWGGPWATRHHLLTRLTRYFPIVWANPAMGWREAIGPAMRRGTADPGGSSGINELDAAAARTRQSGRGGGGRLEAGRHASSRYQTNGPGGNEPPPNLALFWPGRFLPEVFRPRGVARWLEAERLRRARRILTDRGCEKIVLYLWRPQFARSVDLVAHDVSCYHIDDEYSFSPVEEPTSETEARLIRNVDLVLIHSAAMMEKKGRTNPHTRLVPNGVDFAAYSTPAPVPPDLERIPRPRIGYVGMIKDKIDIALLLTLAKRHAAWSFVFVGPRGSLGKTAALIEELERLPNVHFLGPRPVEDLPGYTQHLDVCMLCYVPNDYTKYIYPIKLHEYLATGRPVVGSPIPAVQEFSDVVKIASSDGEWSRAIGEALEPDENGRERTASRQAVARRFDWARLTSEVAEAFCDRLGPGYLDRFEAAMRSEREG